MGYFYSIRFIRFDFTERIISEIFNKLRIYSGHKQTGQRKLTSQWFVITASVLHNDAGFTIDRFNVSNQGLDAARGVFDFKRGRNDLPIRAKNSNHAFPLGNINTNCVHVHK
ncbi:unknown [Hungatella hathewayi CAG:224]|nr:unknown [Hungatella hathewayi CAG:224]